MASHVAPRRDFQALEDRRQRHEQMLAAVREHDIHSWYGRFVYDLSGEVIQRPAEARGVRQRRNKGAEATAGEFSIG